MRARSPTRVYHASDGGQDDGLSALRRSSRHLVPAEGQGGVCGAALSCLFKYLFCDGCCGLGYTPVKREVLLTVHEELETERFNHKIDLSLLYQILPPSIVDAIRTGQRPPNRKFDSLTIYFSDVVGFTAISSQVAEIEVMNMLNRLYSVMDYVTEMFSLYKVETIGDAYMCAGGVTENEITGTNTEGEGDAASSGSQESRHKHHAMQVVSFALVVRKAVAALCRNPLDGTPLQIRVGVHSGPTVSGVVGSLMPRYCLFGDTVNTASRMESNGEPGRIHISSSTMKLIEGYHFGTTSRGAIPIKGKGEMETFFVENGCATNDRCNDAAIDRIITTLKRILRPLPSEQGSSSTSSPPPSPGKFESADSVSLQGRARHLHELADNMALWNWRGSQTIQWSSTHSTSSGSDDRISAGFASIRSKDKQSMGPLSPQMMDRPSVEVPFIPSVPGLDEGHEHERTPSVSGARKLFAKLLSMGGSKKREVEEERERVPQEMLHTVRRSMVRSRSLADARNVRALLVGFSQPSMTTLHAHLKNQHSSWAVDIVQSGEKALEKCKACFFLYDLVVLDDSTRASTGDAMLQAHEVVAIIREYELKQRQQQLLQLQQQPGKRGGRNAAIVVGCLASASSAAAGMEMLLSAGCDQLWQAPLPDNIALVSSVLLALFHQETRWPKRKVVRWAEVEAPPEGK